MMKLKAVANFCRRMGVGLQAGVDILRVLETETRSGDQHHRQVMRAVGEDIRQGCTLSKAMFNAPRHFPPLLIQMVHASELGGRMDSMFLYMANYYDDLYQTRSYFLQRITWPVIQLVLAVGIIGLAILIQGLLARSGSGPNYDATSLGLYGVSGFVLYVAIVGSVAIFSAALVYGIWKNWFNCHRVLMPIVQRIPGLGAALTTLGLSRLSMTMSMLLNAGVDARRSTKQAFLATGNYYYISGMERALGSIERGESFGDALDAAGVFPNEFLEAVRVGELSGTETESLDHLAWEYRERAKAALGFIANLASVAIWIFVMALIAFMIIRLAMQYINMLYSLIP
ncbi:MAG: type II secretion system F family protein [Aureliella sp.]